MNICVYGAASTEIEKSTVEKTEQLGALMAERGHTLVFGGGKNGMMGAVARGVHGNGGKIIGIAPTFFDSYRVYFEHCDEFISTETMRERKQIMEDKSDAFVVTPGGVGTFDEFFEIFTLRTLGRHSKPIAIYNINGYYNPLEKLLEAAVEGGFMTKASKDLCRFFECPEDLLDYLEKYKGETMRIEDSRKIK